MAQRNEHSPAQAWADFTATGRVEDYLRYRGLQNRADAAASITIAGGSHAIASPDPARRRDQGKRPPAHGAYQ